MALKQLFLKGICLLKWLFNLSEHFVEVTFRLKVTTLETFTNTTFAKQKWLVYLDETFKSDLFIKVTTFDTFKSDLLM